MTSCAPATSCIASRRKGSAGTFRFRHALIQEATYLGLLRPERRALHARAAAALEAASRDRLPEVAAVLGRHYATAEDAERAVRYLELAGDHATDAFANYEAISSFNAALAVTRRQPGTMDADAVRLHAKLASVLWRIARRERGRGRLSRRGSAWPARWARCSGRTCTPGWGGLS